MTTSDAQAFEDLVDKVRVSLMDPDPSDQTDRVNRAGRSLASAIRERKLQNYPGLMLLFASASASASFGFAFGAQRIPGSSYGVEVSLGDDTDRLVRAATVLVDILSAMSVAGAILAGGIETDPDS